MKDKTSITVSYDAGRERVLVRIERDGDKDGRAAYETLDLTAREADVLAHKILMELP